ncbi:DNA polymerase IV [Verrucosispora sioxanthis]|uniref:DNA polymerase IV n=1 Tax=Verrucosispora sioxanthis TaxID=2499994 RepID=A0A6M1LAQ4_9ACTN|nr:DNA polymerase IV [Verrucosispora sioxanthis]NEE66223.1 DNA polymerase IV [Verrucosispora sioxanthis]NGM15333.1 DNA polymerase IV [Verrucosispora sioxanthis]
MGRSQSLPRGGDPRFGPGADDAGCPILHVDMDAFYASVEVRHRPELRGRAVVVGGVGARGVVSSASYEARRYGVRSAMPTMRARALCPHAVFLPPDFARYAAASRAVMQIFRDVTPLVEPLSLDEAFLDVAGARRLFGRPAEIARRIRERVATEQGLTCSVGVAPSKFVAKLGSTRAKPDGLLVVPADRVLEFLHPLPVGALWGVGERSEQALLRLGLRTIGDLAQAPPGMLRTALGEAAAAHLHELSWGRDPRRVSPEQAEKSIGAEVTFDVDVDDPAEIRRTLLALAEKVGARLRAGGQVGRTVSLKVRTADFRTVSRARTLDVPTDVAREMFDTSWALYTALNPGERIRLLGVRAEGLTAADQTPQQLALGQPERGWREAEVAADAAAARFGRSVIGPASLLTGRDPRRNENPTRP